MLRKGDAGLRKKGRIITYKRYNWVLTRVTQLKTKPLPYTRCPSIHEGRLCLEAHICCLPPHSWACSWGGRRKRPVALAAEWMGKPRISVCGIWQRGTLNRITVPGPILLLMGWGSVDTCLKIDNIITFLMLFYKSWARRCSQLLTARSICPT